ncbi:hypothetical protein B1L02_12090 [Pseudoalteromonas piscicida]|uniref:Tc1-like transposase DDE domain-containing protein n=1 Tax=Pseudoalteromonas piscicida TaxID=43662 RepID=A0AAD0RNA5_PSEO7|nr:hypothetical protein B1L02_12090 [Pseudoalteromonas piscicida]AXR01613.1 hypothetical protein D0511_05640 [Pseudoalteromonas piscicida]
MSVMKQHLQQISAKTAAGRHAVVLMDGAGWHLASLVTDIDNVAIIKLPPYSDPMYKNSIANCAKTTGICGRVRD